MKSILLKRSFIDRSITYINNSKTTWYDYYWNINKEGIYEWHESNSFRTERVYFKYNNEDDEIIILSMEEVIEYINRECKIVCVNFRKWYNKLSLWREHRLCHFQRKN